MDPDVAEVVKEAIVAGSAIVLGLCCLVVLGAEPVKVRRTALLFAVALVVTYGTEYLLYVNNADHALITSVAIGIPIAAVLIGIPLIHRTHHTRS